MKTRQITFIIIASLMLFGFTMSGCSSSSSQVSSKRRNHCVTTKPTNSGFLKYIECGYFK